MDKNKVLSVLEKLSQNIVSCNISYIDKNLTLDSININGNNIAIAELKEEFNKYKVGAVCKINKIVFQPKESNFLVTIKDDNVTCSKYAEENEAKKIIEIINNLLFKDCIKENIDEDFLKETLELSEKVIKDLNIVAAFSDKYSPEIKYLTEQVLLRIEKDKCKLQQIKSFKEIDVWYISCSTGCTCCSYKDFNQGFYKDEKEPQEIIKGWLSGIDNPLSSQYAKYGCYDVIKTKAEVLIDGRMIICGRVFEKDFLGRFEDSLI